VDVDLVHPDLFQVDAVRVSGASASTNAAATATPAAPTRRLVRLPTALFFTMAPRGCGTRQAPHPPSSARTAGASSCEPSGRNRHGILDRDRCASVLAADAWSSRTRIATV